MKLSQMIALTLLIPLMTPTSVRSSDLRYEWRDFSGDGGRFARLASLGRVWGAAKIFHPELARPGTDWDQALVESIQSVDSARTEAEFLKALNGMLLRTGDTTSLVVSESMPGSLGGASPARASTPVTVLPDGIVVLTMSALTLDEDSIDPEAIVNQALDSKGIIIDLRVDEGATSEFVAEVSDMFSEIAASLVDRQIPLAANRYRTHVGYVPQRGASTGGFYSGVAVQRGGALPGRAKRAAPPTVILVNKIPVGAELVIGLQSAGVARVVQEGTAQSMYYAETLPVGEGLTLSLSVARLVSPVDGTDFRADSTVAASAVDSEARKLIFKPIVGSRTIGAGANNFLLEATDDPYIEMKFPSRPYRLLALFRYWNVINYFYPYKALIGRNWDDVLPRYVELLGRSENQYEYESALRRLSAEIHDTHGFIGPTPEFAKRTGLYTPAVGVRRIGGNSVVVAIAEQNGELRRGDVILEVDGENIDVRLKRLSEYYSASTPQAASMILNAIALRGEKESLAELKVRRSPSQVLSVKVSRSEEIASPKVLGVLRRDTPSFSVLPGGYGYVDMERLQFTEIDKMFETIKGTKGTIFDLRGYPKGTGATVASRLARKRGLPATLYSIPIVSADSIGDSNNHSYQLIQRLPVGKSDPYLGKVVVLIDERTASQGEHAALMFSAATAVTFVGSPSAGVDGDVTSMLLPGGISASFSGAAVSRADGRQIQRIGIQPDIPSVPTIAGIAAGRDEVLESAISVLARPD